MLLFIIISNFGRNSDRFRYIVSFSLKSAHFSYPLYSNPKLKMFPLH